MSEASSGPDKFDLSESVGVITRFNPEGGAVPAGRVIALAAAWAS